MIRSYMKPTKYQNGDYYRSLTQKMILTIIIVSLDNYIQHIPSRPFGENQPMINPFF